MMRHLFTLLLAGLAVAGASAQGALDKISPSLLADARRGQSVPFVILLSRQADVSAARQIHGKAEKSAFVYDALVTTARATQPAVERFLHQFGAPSQSLFIVNALRSEGSADLIIAAAARPDVARVMADPAIHAADPVAWREEAGVPRSGIEWGLGMIQADDVWNMGYTGQGVVVGGQDTGYDWTHPALKGRYRGYAAEADTVDHNYNWHDAIHEISPLNGDSINPCGLDARVPCDDNGHGTHTMGTMIGLDGANQIGVAPDAQWCACRNMERGWGSPFTYLECFQWFLAPTDLNNEHPNPAKAPHVINNSWSCPEVEGCDTSNWHLLDMAVNNLRMAGTVVVVSAGNSGSGCGSVSTPAAMFEGSFSVGATRSNDTIAGFSSRGPVFVDGSNRLKPNVAAPGVDVRSSFPGGNYGYASGTSMAGPHVAGLVALVISANPDLAGEVDMLEDIIEQTAVPKTTEQQCGDIAGSQIPNAIYGYGRVDALAAVEAALALIGTGTSDVSIAVPLRIWPSPARDRITIRLPENLPTARIEIFSADGRPVLLSNWTSGMSTFVNLSVSGWPPGLYACRVMTIDGLFTGKFVKE